MTDFLYTQDALPEDKISYRPPTVAGTFYPDNPDTLRATLRKLFEEERPGKLTGRDIVGIVSPHAGYDFSGKAAGRVYKELIGRKYDAVIIVAPSHHESFSGASVYNGDSYVTPLGEVMTDKALCKSISSFDTLIKYSNSGHKWKGITPEHSLEVQLPFLQVALPGTPIVPIVMSTQDFTTQDVLMRAIVKSVREAKKKVLLVASSDLSHFHSYDTARSIDLPAVRTFARMDYFAFQSLHQSGSIEACGGGPISAVMMAAEQLGATLSTPIIYYNSGDTEKGNSRKDRVVGYFSGAIINADYSVSELTPKIDENNRTFLMDLAKKSIKETVLGTSDSLTGLLIPTPLAQSLSAFVTIKKSGQLRACMGYTYPNDNLANQVILAARLASTSDYRFGPVQANELDSLDYEITVLSRLRRILDINEIEIGKDGLYIRLGRNSGLLLPQVASDTNWTVTTFLENLCDKAGLPADSFKSPKAQIFAFRALIIDE